MLNLLQYLLLVKFPYIIVKLNEEQSLQRSNPRPEQISAKSLRVK